jgi:hypothetical protein
MNKKGQGSPEFNVVISFVALAFLVVLILVFQKQNEAYDFQVFLEARKVTTRLADNINIISQNGHGYYKYFELTDYLYGLTPYDLEARGNFLWINYTDHTWSKPIITSNVTILKLDKGEDNINCIANEDGEVVINTVCGFSDQGCGTVQNCDPDDWDICPTCDSPEPVEIHENSKSTCESFGCTTLEQHFYTVVPTDDGTLQVTFESNLTDDVNQKTDIMFYDYSEDGCGLPHTYFQLEPSTVVTHAVKEGETYIIGLDVDYRSCNRTGAYTLKTKLV